MKTILVPVDFSPVSRKQAEYAAFLAQKLNAEILLCNVISDNVYIGISGTGDVLGSDPLHNMKMIQNSEDYSHEKLIVLQKELSQCYSEIKWKIKTLRGDAVYELLRQIEKYLPTLVLMGMNKTEEGTSASGSVIIDIVKKSVVPVWVYLDKESTDHEFRKVVYTTDFMHPDKEIIEDLLAFLKPFSVKLYCVHICLDGNYLRAFSRMSDLKAYFKNEYLEEKIVFDVLEERKAGIAINNFIQQNQIDLISYVPTSKNMFERLFRNRLSRKHIIETKLPILAWKVRDE